MKVAILVKRNGVVDIGVGQERITIETVKPEVIAEVRAGKADYMIPDRICDAFVKDLEDLLDRHGIERFWTERHT